MADPSGAPLTPIDSPRLLDPYSFAVGFERAVDPMQPSAAVSYTWAISQAPCEGPPIGVLPQGSIRDGLLVDKDGALVAGLGGTELSASYGTDSLMVKSYDVSLTSSLEYCATVTACVEETESLPARCVNGTTDAAVLEVSPPAAAVSSPVLLNGTSTDALAFEVSVSCDDLSGIESASLSLGTSALATDVLTSLDVPLNGSASTADDAWFLLTAENITGFNGVATLTSSLIGAEVVSALEGRLLYTTLTCVDYAGLSVAVSSPPLRLDTQPPVIGALSVPSFWWSAEDQAWIGSSSPEDSISSVFLLAHPGTYFVRSTAMKGAWIPFLFCLATSVARSDHDVM